MSIFDFQEKIKEINKTKTLNDFLIILVIILVAFGSFGLGRLSKNSEINDPIQIVYPEQNQTENNAVSIKQTAQVNQAFNSTTTNTLEKENTTSSKEQSFVASKNGTKYYFIWCSGANKIKEENKIYFSSREEAEKAGYEKSSTCKGL